MIPESVLQQQSCASGADWKLALAQSFRHRSELLEYCELQNKLPAFSEDSGFPTRVTRHYASLIEKGNAQDPLLLQVLNDLREHEQLPGYHRDAVGDMDAMVAPGLLHKYASRVLLTLTAACPIHCRYCFRRHFPYREANADVSPDGAIMQYLQNHAQINEVILSGGDPLMWNDQKLAALIQSLNPLKHIKTLRIHSRLLSVLPERIDDDFIKLWHAFHGHVVFVTHINHPNEISAQNRAAFARLAERGYRLFNQSALLKGINDSPAVLSELSYKLFDSHITPYYLHALDKVQGAAHFDLDVQQQCQIYQALRSRLPGYLLPQLVNEFAGRTSKTPVQCC
jgi:EF-P beta-lysylation protein EpmB